MDIKWTNKNWETGLIALFDNPFENIPTATIKQGKEAIKYYFEHGSKLGKQDFFSQEPKSV